MTHPKDPEAERVADKLSEKMRFNVATARETLNGGFVMRAWMSVRERNALRARGLSKLATFNQDLLTPLGERVRTILKGAR